MLVLKRLIFELDDKQDNLIEGLFFLLYFVLVFSHFAIMFEIPRALRIWVHFQATLSGNYEPQRSFYEHFTTIKKLKHHFIYACYHSFL